MSSLAKARESLLKAQGIVKVDQTVEERILAQDRQPPLTQEETAAQQASEVAGGDWGPVFIYGQMLSQQAWCALIGRMPDMRPCWLRGYERRAINRSTFAGLIKKTEDDESIDQDCLTVGQAVSGLKPWERRLLDQIVDDGFEMVEVVIQPLDDLKENLQCKCTTYVWRKERYPEAILKTDWDQEGFNGKLELEFTALCVDVLELYKTTKISDEELKEKALRRRREMTGFEDEEEWKPEEEEEEVDEDKENQEDY